MGKVSWIDIEQIFTDIMCMVDTNLNSTEKGWESENTYSEPKLKIISWRSSSQLETGGYLHECRLRHVRVAPKNYLQMNCLHSLIATMAL